MSNEADGPIEFRDAEESYWWSVIFEASVRRNTAIGAKFVVEHARQVADGALRARRARERKS